MNDLLKSLGNATETEREKIIRDAGYEFTYDELKQALMSITIISLMI